MVNKNSDSTRQQLLMAAYEDIHLYGFQAASLSRILAKTSLTKGALYHHFKSKIELGYAVVGEIVAQEKMACWVNPLTQCDNPISCMIDLLKEATSRADHQEICQGFVLHNLAQEMSPIDEGFRLRINHIYESWQQGLCAALKRGQKQGLVRRNVDANAAAVFIVAAMNGCMAISKQAQDVALLRQCSKGLVEYLENLRA